MSFSRRDLLKLGAGATAIWMTELRSPNAWADQSKKKIGLQLFSVRDVCEKDLARALQSVRQIGYQGVEFADADHYGHEPEDMRKMLDQSGLICCGTHLLLSTLLDDAFQKTVEFHKALGCTNLTIHGLPAESLVSIATLVAAAKLLTEISDKLKPYGMHFGYHAQARDIKRVEGQIPIEVVLAHAGPDVHLQLDTGHCAEGGADPVALLKRFRDRSRSIHLAVFGGPQDAIIGGGDVNWKGVLEFCKATDGIEWYIVEHYQPSRRTSLEVAKLNLESLRNMGV
ncbi:MAG: sugar phosphate isomerase/epimerase [Planctomycetes bacterium]|nr:sugar phosphate isomerase/epimerase [Planctomycetota bacterium]